VSSPRHSSPPLEAATSGLGCIVSRIAPIHSRLCWTVNEGSRGHAFLWHKRPVLGSRAQTVVTVAPPAGHSMDSLIGYTSQWLIVDDRKHIALSCVSSDNSHESAGTRVADLIYRPGTRELELRDVVISSGHGEIYGKLPNDFKLVQCVVQRVVPHFGKNIVLRYKCLQTTVCGRNSFRLRALHCMQA